ncbi:MAG: hypothetical protein KGL39_14770 [Patescibacteria group bacterium]|nr:hypothetical protein [Patescibacteria group bacterium]
MGGGNSATQAAQQQQQQQQQAVNQNVSAINSAFANRQSQYSNYLGALNKSYQTQLNLQQADASRNLKFALARSGMTGGSVAADQGANLQREMGQATLGASEQAQAKLAALESSDAATQQQMIALAQSGANIGNAAGETAAALKANLDNAQSNLGPNTLGQAFGGLTNTINQMNQGYQTRLGLRAAQAYAGAFSNNATTASGYGNAGTGM